MTDAEPSLNLFPVTNRWKNYNIGGRPSADLWAILPFLEDAPGVYVIWRNGQCAYVGQGVNVARRSLRSLANVYLASPTNTEDRFELWITLVRYENLLRTEANAIAWFKPTLNTAKMKSLKTKDPLPPFLKVDPFDPEPRVPCEGEARITRQIKRFQEKSLVSRPYETGDGQDRES